MRMKADIEIVTGFIGAGKTSFINALIQDTIIEGEKILVIQCESGENQIQEKIENKLRIILKKCSHEELLDKRYLKFILDLYRPSRVIIELNGTMMISELLEYLQRKELIDRCKITTMFHITDAVTFDLYLSNMGSMLIPPIQISNLILINNTDSIKEKDLENIKSTILKLNSHGHIMEVKNKRLLQSTISESNIFDNGFLKKCRVFIKNVLSN